MSSLKLEDEVYNGNYDKVKALIDAGANPNKRLYLSRAGPGGTPLHVAAMKGYIDIIELLLESGANIDAVNDDQETPLYKSCNFNQLDAVKVLLRYGANPNTSSGLHDYNTLQPVLSRLKDRFKNGKEEATDLPATEVTE